jgi:hypothetical protein
LFHPLDAGTHNQAKFAIEKIRDMLHNHEHVSLSQEEKEEVARKLGLQWQSKAVGNRTSIFKGKNKVAVADNGSPSVPSAAVPVDASNSEGGTETAVPDVLAADRTTEVDVDVLTQSILDELNAGSDVNIAATRATPTNADTARMSIVIENSSGAPSKDGSVRSSPTPNATGTSAEMDMNLGETTESLISAALEQLDGTENAGTARLVEAVSL